jgi:D-glycero-beta-D-manno-heptose-7-phosphate kinase
MSGTLPNFANARVLVVGDVMLDRYWFGDVNRISQEERPGGAANVARNIAALGGKVTLLSVVGDDEAGHALEALLSHEAIDASLLRDSSISTTVKLRVMGARQQLLRIDFEKTPSREVLADKLDEFSKALASSDAVLLSDYGKGGLAHVTEMIRLARAAGKPVLVDPKGSDWSKYAGASVITPNRAEFRDVAGRWLNEAELAQKAQQVRSQFALDALIVTRSEEGMSLFTQDDVVTVATRAREVFDVSGAGDTVIATLALMVASGKSLRDAMQVANAAAGVVVGKLGTATVNREELVYALAQV